MGIVHSILHDALVPFSLSLDDCDVDDDDKDDLDDLISQSLKDRSFDPHKPSWHTVNKLKEMKRRTTNPSRYKSKSLLSDGDLLYPLRCPHGFERGRSILLGSFLCHALAS